MGCNASQLEEEGRKEVVVVIVAKEHLELLL